MPDAHKNFAVSAVATAPSPATSGTSLVVTAGHGTRFPAVPFNATIWPTAAQPTPANAEIVRVTNISTNTLTITRAQESSTARAVVVGDQIAATVTAKTLTDVETESVILAPASSARNVIIPTAGTVIAAIVKAHASQSVDLMQWQTSGGTAVLSVSSTGVLNVRRGEIQNAGLVLSRTQAAFNQSGYLFVDDGTTAGLKFNFYNQPDWGVEFALMEKSLGGSDLVIFYESFAVGDPWGGSLQLLVNGDGITPMVNGKFSIFGGDGIGNYGASQQTASTLADLWAAMKAWGWLNGASTAPSLGSLVSAAVILAPGSSARNVIQATAGTAVPLIVKAHASQSVDLSEWQKSDGTVLASVGANGTVAISPAGSARSLTVGSATSFAPAQDADYWFSDSTEVIRAASADGYFPWWQAEDVARPNEALVQAWGSVDAGVNTGFISTIQRLISTGRQLGFATFSSAGLSIADGNGDGVGRTGTIAFDVLTGLIAGGGAGRVRLYSSVDTSVKTFDVGATGALITPNNAAKSPLIFSGGTLPASADFAASQLGFWFDPTNGAAKLMAKGKTANGTVVTWEIPSGVIYVVGGTDVAVADGGTGASTAAGARTNLGLVIGTDVASQASDDAKVPKSLYDANTILAATTDDTPAALTVAASTILGRKASGNIAAMTATEAKAVLVIAESDVTNLTTDLAAKVPKSLFDANTVLAADTDDTPAAVTMGASTILARLAAGNIKAATPAELRTLLDVPTTGEAILDTLVDAKGDLIAATAADTVARLAVGADETLALVPDSSQSTGLNYAVPSPFAGRGYKSGRYYVAGEIGMLSSTAVPAEARVYAMRFYCRKTTTFDRISTWQTGVGTAGAVVRMGIYADDGNAYPGALVLDAGTFDATGANVAKAITISQSLTRGLYWAVAVVQGGAGTRPTLSVATMTSGIAPSEMGAPGIWENALAYYADSVSGALGTPFNTTPLSIGTAPALWLRAA